MTANITKIEIEGDKYPIRAPFGALAEIEAHFELESIMDINDVFSDNISGKNLMDFMAILLKWGGNENYEELAGKCDATALEQAINHLSAAMGVDKNPPQAARNKAKRTSRSVGTKRRS